jgi:20S proteasome subunit alpha 1
MSRGGSMGFDRHITIFSPEGRLFQVEYASKATKLSCSTCIAVKNIDTVCAVILNKKKGGKHQSQSNFKIFSLSEFMGCIYNGLNGDIQMKIQETIIESTDFFEKFNYKIPMDYLIKRISDRNQFFTQYAYMRPLGVKMLIMGYLKFTLTLLFELIRTNIVIKIWNHALIVLKNLLGAIKI